MPNLYSKLLESSSEVNVYFFYASNIYIATGKEDARLASLAAAKVAAIEQRNYLVNYLENNLDNLTKICKLDLPKEEYYQNCYTRAEELIREINKKDWGIWDCIKAKNELYRKNKNYLAALESSNSELFIKEYDDTTVNFLAHVSLDVKQD